MMRVGDATRYARHRTARAGDNASILHELVLPILLFGGIGGIAWGIRGTSGWAPIDGTVVPGLTWGLLWYYLCYRKGIDARGLVLWLGMGIALGGQLGYGRYVAWIQGNFAVGDEIMPVAPWVGAAWFFICGIGWGAPGGILLGWAHNDRVSDRRWVGRVMMTLILLALLFNLGRQALGEGIVSWAGDLIRHACPWLIFPNSAQGFYAGELDGHLGSTVYLNTQNFLVFLWWIAAMIIAAVNRERATIVAGAVIGGGFGFGFLLSALWVLGYTYAPGFINWWKVWEVHAGINLGLLYALVLYWALRRFDNTHTDQGKPIAQPPKTDIEEWKKTAFWAVSGFTLVVVAGIEYYFWTIVPTAVFFVVALYVAMRLPGIQHNAVERRLGVTLAFSAFLLVYLLVHGSSKTTGVVLGLYPLSEAAGYRWPAGRILLFLPATLILLAATVVAMNRMLRAQAPPGLPAPGTTRLTERLLDLFMFTGVVGALTVMPEGLHRIESVYAICLLLTVFAHTRLNRRFDSIDATGSSVQDRFQP